MPERKFPATDPPSPRQLRRVLRELMIFPEEVALAHCISVDSFNQLCARRIPVTTRCRVQLRDICFWIKEEAIRLGRPELALEPWEFCPDVFTPPATPVGVA
jgi:hypothetical protein